ncbi:MAG TPA: BadF/BadG/BcrA/BcrD ATPase family protein [Ferruginibacter sp.]|nr:benzoyl-CoA reductase subunit A [Bacteroidota bacterium]MBS1925394.1 benzoyl-CoA reductase subunit A [Bacteroidota bacterium]MCC6693574.1 benzoyl-CoA reductase subunit A [Chitinophagaceae bacterium]HMT95264.1 BadF/BadG/BcrA/BcrD ATPase family protein [Ferruginibacter sp.]
MNKYYLGVDLGSTTSKAVIINEQDEIIGRGITNTRANYSVAADIAKDEAIYNARFSILKKKLEAEIKSNPAYSKYINDLESVFQYEQFKIRLDKLGEELLKTCYTFFKDAAVQEKMIQHLRNIRKAFKPVIKHEYLYNNLGAKNQFFRDIVSEKYNDEVNKLEMSLFEPLMTVWDKSISPAENQLITFNFKELVEKAMDELREKYKNIPDEVMENTSVNFDAELNLLKGNFEKVYETLRVHIDEIAGLEFNITNMTGTGYGRALLPFPQECIRSEILCHAFGAHAVFPDTRTVLDIGGQDTKAIQVDRYGLVTSFQMNDRCAAGCGRYLGYIADEMSISLNELGPMALKAEKEVNICSTCTVFAGAELRELTNLGEKREDILGGLHKAIIMRAMSLLARSGGVFNEFTFTGGVARNPAVIKYLSELVKENYGDQIKINIHIDSIFMGALGGAMFARRNMNLSLPTGKAETA